MDHLAPVLTIGHSNRDEGEFLDLLAAHGIEGIVDVRAFPGSRRMPHFGQDQLRATLERNGIDYDHVRGLGGRRRSTTDDPDPRLGDAWRNASFRAYARYTHTAAYADALAHLEQLAEQRLVAIMCSEAVPWRCHRWLVSDTLVARGHVVLHVLDEGLPRLHELSPFARRDGARVTWPGPESELTLALGPRVALEGAVPG